MKARMSAKLVIGALLLAVPLSACGGALEGDPGSPTAPSSSALPSGQVKVQGAIADQRGNCPNLTFAIGSERIITNGNTQFQRVACSGLQNDTLVEAEGVRQANGAILAREVELEAPQVPAGVEVEVEGFIARLTGTCPAQTFNIGSARIRTTAATEFKRIPCSSLQNGMNVEVEGVQSDGSVLAREVEPDEVRVEGAIAGLNGTCPERSFAAGAQRVRTLVSTRFDDIACTTLQTGIQVEVRGVQRPDGVLLATRVRPLEQRREREEGRAEGSISALTGSCPTRSFNVAGQMVTTHSGTRFDDVSCGGLREGMQVEVRGFRQPNGSILADRVKQED